jgi:hypothetical protein
MNVMEIKIKTNSSKRKNNESSQGMCKNFTLPIKIHLEYSLIPEVYMLLAEGQMNACTNTEK